jgi:hypothetical protein
MLTCSLRTTAATAWHIIVTIRQGLPAATAKDWLKDAEARLLTDQSVKALQAHVTLVNLALAKAASA